MDTKPEHNRNSEPIEENRENKAPKIHVLVLAFIHTHTHTHTRAFSKAGMWSRRIVLYKSISLGIA